jgi:hypothetical protein
MHLTWRFTNHNFHALFLVTVERSQSYNKSSPSQASHSATTPSGSVTSPNTSLATKNILKRLTKSARLPRCCNSESLHPSNHRGCSCAKKDLQRRKLYNANPYTPSGLHFTSKLSPGKSYAAAVANWHPSSEYCRASTRQMHWRRYGYINHHSPAADTGLLSLCEQFMKWLCKNKGQS